MLVRMTLPEYEWNQVFFNGFWATTDEDEPVLIAALMRCSPRAAFALTVACAEWVVARVEGELDVTEARQRIELGWRAAMDPLSVEMAFPPPSPASLPAHFASPLRLSMKLLAYGLQKLRDDEDDVRSIAQGTAMLARHVYDGHPVFEAWLQDSLRRLAAAFPEGNLPVPHGALESSAVALQRLISDETDQPG